MVSSIRSACSAVVDAPYTLGAWLSAKVEQIATAIFSYLARIFTFQMGEMHRPLANRLIRLFQIINSDPREQTPFDPKRLAASIELLKAYGGKELFLDTADGQKVHAMTFTASDFMQALSDRGFHWVDITYEEEPRLALPIHKELEKFGFPKIKDPVRGEMLLVPKSPPYSHTPPHIIQCHSPGRSMGMDRKVIGMHLAAGYDITVWDPRGTTNSTGVASEGGFYLDADAVFKYVRDKSLLNKIYVAGFCKGAAIATYLKQQYHDKGVHLIASNPFTSMKEVFEGYGLIGRLGVRYGIQAITDPTLHVKQDYFDNEAKLRGLSLHGGRCIFIHTDTDKMMPAGTVDRLKTAFDHSNLTYEILRKHPNPKVNGHMQPPYEDPKVWEEYIKVVI
jgi:hypothetical protein